MRRTLFALLLSGCVIADATPAIQSAAVAERRLGTSGTNALDSIAQVSSAAAVAMRQAGEAVDHSGHALDGVANLISSVAAATDEVHATLADARPRVSSTLDDVAALTSEASAIAALARENVEDGWLGKRIGYVIAAGIAVSIIHAMVSAYRTRVRLDETLRHVRPKS